MAMHRKHLAILTAAALLGASVDTAPARAQQREHCGTITNNETWTPAANPHLIKCTVTVRNAVLSIAPATQVLFAEGTSLILQAGGGLQAIGDPTTGPVRFLANTGDDPEGYWGQIRFESGAASSKLERVIVRGGGAGEVPMIEVHDALAEINLAQLSHSLGPPLGYWANALGPSLEAAGQATTQTECEGLPHPLLSLDNDATIRVEAAGHPVVVAQNWHHFCAPYIVQGSLVVAGPEEPLLSLEKGVTLKFAGDTGLVVGESEAAKGQLATNGSTQQPVVLTATTASPGAWLGLDLTEWSGFSSLITARIEYGGRGDRPMVRVASVDASAIDVTFRGALGYPLAVVSDAVGGFLGGVAPEGKEVFLQNGVQRVLVVTDPAGEDVTFPTSEWTDPGVPYELDGNLTIGDDGGPARLTVTAGATLLFREGMALEVTPGAALVAKGARAGQREVPVTFGGLDERPGAWRGIVVDGEADVVQLDLAVLENGGSAEAAMLAIGATAGTVTRTTFRGAPGYPVSVPLSVAPDIIMGDDQLGEGMDMRNRLADNGADRVLVQVDGPITATRLRDWADPGAPVEFDGPVVAASSGGPRLVWHDGLDLRFRQGAGFTVSGAGQRGNIEVVDDDPEQSVRLGPVEPTAGWSGLVVQTGGTLRGADLTVWGAASGQPNLHANGGQVELTGLKATSAAPDGGTAGPVQPAGIGLDADAGAQVTLIHGDFRDLEIGLRTRQGARLDITQSIVAGNRDWGIKNEDPTVCQRAFRIWWGQPTGPVDDNDAPDACLDATNPSPGADRVSNDVDWWPYAINDTDFTPSSGIGPGAKEIYLPWAYKP
jgi:hypothetical protein